MINVNKWVSMFRLEGDTEEARKGSTVTDLSEPGTFKIIRPGSALGMYKVAKPVKQKSYAVAI